MKCRECPWFNAKYPNYCYTLSEPITPSKDICADMETFAEKFSENIISENARLRKVVEAARVCIDHLFVADDQSRREGMVKLLEYEQALKELDEEAKKEQPMFSKDCRECKHYDGCIYCDVTGGFVNPNFTPCEAFEEAKGE